MPMQILGRCLRASVGVLGFALGIMLSTGAMAQTTSFHFHFDGQMSCMQPVPISNAPVSGDGAGVLNPDGSVSAEITQGLSMFRTAVHFDSKLGSGVTPAPGGTGQVRVV